MNMVQANAIPEVGVDEILIADIGSGIATHGELFGPKATIVRFDIQEEVKPDVICDIRQMDPHWFGRFDYVHASHTLEHFRRGEAKYLLEHWAHLLKVGGKLVIHVPNLEHAMNLILSNDVTDTGAVHYAWQQIYGDQAKPGAPWQHLNGFTPQKLRGLFSTLINLTDVTVETEHDGLNLKATATLGKEFVPYTLTSAWEEIAKKEGGLKPVRRRTRVKTS